MAYKLAYRMASDKEISYRYMFADSQTKTLAIHVTEVNITVNAYAREEAAPGGGRETLPCVRV